MNKKWLSCLAVGMLLVTGCNDPQPPQAQGNMNTMNTTNQNQPNFIDGAVHGVFGVGPMNYLSYNRQRATYDRMGEFHKGASYITPQSERPTLENDQALIHHIIEDEYGMEAGMVIIAGSHAFVNVTPPEDLSDEDKKKEMGKLKRALLQEVPRYQVHVSERNA
ncbi:hypothetical protein [Halalkalibacter alkalisediminis]|uniref:Uncharacterized protein n=1 Tax=Halalkalibacter alkalisediminis TaxID=935616 RepID=A0ABV6NJX9_9BACI|nr:hypothetical protein [Halalkalibacter alkalisediminis]